jgi:WD40 repeat protein
MRRPERSLVGAVISMSRKTVGDLPRTEPFAETVTVTGSVADSPSPTLSAGDLPVVDPRHFAIIGEHARGGLGRILAAEDVRLGRPIAVKELLYETPESSRRFIREARMTARLQHPAIIPVYEAGRWPAGKMFYAMKLVSGRSLKEIVAGTRGIDERLALLPNLISVAEAIGYAHSKRIVHRDLKPSNIMIGEFGETVVIDWGLAKDLDEVALSRAGDEGPFRTPPDEHTIAGTVLGTPAYMPPEQAEGAEVDERADVYSLGAMLYYVLAGAAPYAGASAIATLEQVLATPPRPLELREPGVPRELATIVAKAMARQKEQRYRDGSAIAEDLRRFQTGQLVGAHRYSRTMLARRWLRRHRSSVLVAAVLLAVLAIAMVVSVRRIIRERNTAQSERALARKRAHALTLTQARTSLAVDPTATIGWLKTYPVDGREQGAARALAADAAGRGVARYVLRAPHNALGAALSPDGKNVVAGGEAEGLRAWSLQSGSVRTLPFRTTAHFIEYSPDGRWLAASGEYGRLAIWSGAGGQYRELVEHRAMIEQIAFAPDGRSLLTLDAGNTACLWDVAIGRCQPLRFANATAAYGDFDRDGTPFVVVARDRVVELWNLRARALVTRLPHGARVEMVRSALAGGMIVTAAGGRLHAWDIHRATPIVEIPTRAQRFVVSRDGRRIAEWQNDRTIVVHEIDRGSTRVLDQPQRVFTAAFSPDGTRLATGGVGGVVTVWDSEADASQTFMGHTGLISHLAFSSDGRTLVSCGNEDHTVRVWQPAATTRRVLRQRPGIVLQSSFSADGRLLATASSGGSAQVWSVSDGRSLRMEHHPDLVQDVAFSPDTKWWATASWDGTATWTNLDTGATGVLRHGARVQRVLWLPRSTTLATASMDGAISVWSIPEGTRTILGRHEGPVSRLALSPDGQSLLTAGDDATVRLWDLTSGRGRIIGRHDDGVNRAAFFPDGRSIVSAGADGSVRLWDLATGHWRVLRDRGTKLNTVIVSPNGGFVAAAGADGTIYSWNVARAMEPSVLRAHAAAIRNLAFSPDSRRLASAGYDHAVGVWSLDTGAGAILHGHEGNVIAVAFSPDGQTLATASADATVRLWASQSIELLPTGDVEFRRWLANATNFAIANSDEQ